MKKQLCAVLLLIMGLSPLWALARGEEDPLWGKPTYEKKVSRIGLEIITKNNIQQSVGFMVERQQDSVQNAYANGATGDVVITRALLHH